MGEKNKELIYNLKLKVFGKEFNPAHSHSFLVADAYTGVSSPVGELNINIRTMTLKQLRPIIQYDRTAHMNKRSLMFQEALFIMSRLPNYYNREEEDLNRYQFGFLKKDGSDIKVIKVEHEEKPISELIGTVDFFDYDLLIVPLSQIPPNYTR